VTLASVVFEIATSFGATPTVSQAGVIDDAGASGVGALHVDLSAAQMNRTGAYVFRVVVTDSLGEQVVYDKGYLQQVVGAGSDAAVASVRVLPGDTDAVHPGTLQLVAAAYDGNGDPVTSRPLTWSSSDPAIATVSATGLVTSVAVGDVTITAECGGQSAAAPIHIAPDYVVRDSFERTDSATSLGYADTGQAWSTLNGTWGIDDGKAYLVASGGGVLNAAVVDAGIADCAIESTIIWTTDSLFWPVAFRCTDASNGFRVVNDNATLAIYRVQAGALTSIAFVVVAISSGDRIGIELSGNNITAKVNGVTVVTASDSFQATATKHGIGMDVVREGRYAAFSVARV
jgi:Big-like domain-containing protein